VKYKNCLPEKAQPRTKAQPDGYTNWRY